MIFEPATTFAACLFILVGISLGLLGGGGSVLSVPILVYIANLSVTRAIPLSLLIVGLTSFLASLSYFKRGNVHLRAAFMFGLSGVLGSTTGAHLTHFVNERALVTLFGILMVIVGFLMVFKKRRTGQEEANESRPATVIILSGLGIGALTGFLGIGGGFLLVPALLYIVRIPIRQAIGTSLILISFNSLAGFFSHLRLVEIPIDKAILFTSLALLGASLGTRLAREVDARHLRKGFGIFIFCIGTTLVFFEYLR